MIFMMIGAEFVSLLVLIIYVGAISILFIFVIMLLNLRLVDLYTGLHNYLPIGGFIGILLVIEIIIFIFMDFGTYMSELL
jgi:NADH-quinone oxidoreductase subunit J